MMQTLRRCAIVGGGMLGIGLALKLARDPRRRVTLYESAPALGGLAAPWELGGIYWDRHYHVILPSDGHLVALLRELGLERELRWTPARSAFYIDERLYPFTTMLDFLRFPLPLRDKLRLRETIARARRLPAGGAWREQTAEHWLRTTGGDRLFERVWRPLLRAKLGDDYRDVSAAFIVATIKRLQSDYGKKLRGKFGYVRGGYATIIDRLNSALRGAGVRVRCSAPVRAVERGTKRLLVQTYLDVEDFDEVVLTLPPPLAASLTRSLTDAERARWLGVRYRGVLCTSLLLDRRLGDAYVTNLADERLPFTGIIEMTNLVPPGTFGGLHLVYLPRYVALDDPYASRTNEEISADVFSTLPKVFPRFNPVDVRALRISRVPYVFALPECDASRGVHDVATSVPGLYLVSSAQILDGTLNVNETLSLAERAAATIERTPAAIKVSAA
ncbi:MAG: FAD-dependent oxidoreductase [Candidatus Eremiobacteraeota bacterium]|nr:FAD-dependent oxidoreductase [Candidatus Eremiobacteraeota bacterium]